MDYENIYRQILALDPYETFARQYYNLHGQYLSSQQYLYLLKRGVSGIPKTDFSLTAQTDIQKISEHFDQQNQNKVLREELFMNAENTIEAEKLPRYISIPAHKHDFIEISCILSGECTHIVEGKKHLQKAGTLSFITRFQEHQMLPAPDCICITLKVQHDTFLKFQIPNLPYFSTSICFFAGEDAFYRNTVLALYAQHEKHPPYKELVMNGLLQCLLAYCMQQYKHTIKILGNGYANDPLDLEMVNYLYENYQTVSLHSMALHFHFSDSYLSSHLHRILGTTFQTSIRKLRLHKASELLVQSDMTLNEICSFVGYRDTTQFIRNFKEIYGVTPGKYRKIRASRFESAGQNVTFAVNSTQAPSRHTENLS